MAICALAQEPATGFPPYGSFESGRFDAVNRQSLNVNFAIPIVSSPGRGTNFTFSIIYDSLLWQKVANAWTPVVDATGNPTWGWKKVSPTGSIRYSKANITCVTDSGIRYSATAYAGYVYTDPTGTKRDPGISFQIPDCVGGFQAHYALDGSGYYVDASLPDNPVVWGPQGFKFTADGTLTDTNGNIISQGVTGWTDTANHTALRIIKNGSNIEYHYLDSTRADQKLTLKFQNYTVQTNFNCSGVTDYNVSGTLPPASLPYELDFPNSRAYLFSYELTPGVTQPQPPNPPIVTGRMATVTLPTGGSYQYSYPTTAPYGMNCADGSVTNLTRTISDGSTSGVWQFFRTQVDAATWKTTVTAPKLAYDSAGNDTVFTFTNGAQTSQQIYQGSSTGTPTLLRAINTAWAANGTPMTQTVILEDNQTQAQTETTFDPYGNLLFLKEHDWGTGTPGPVLRTTTYTYKTDFAYTSRNILNRLTNQTVYQGDVSWQGNPPVLTGTVKSRTDIAYDEAPYINTVCPLGVAQHDDTNYGCTFTTRGNPTTVTKYTDPVTPVGGIAQHTSYDFFGNAVKADVNCCQQEQWVYSATTNYAYPDSVVRGPSGNQLTTRATYNSYTGLLASSTDENNQAASYSYDLMKRILSITRPDSAQITYAYNDTALTVTVGTPIQGSNVQKQVTSFDGLGRPIRATVMDNGTPATTYSIADTQYDPVGRPYKTSNPYTGASASYWTTTQFDALAHPVLTILPDNSQASSSYSTNTVTRTDPAGKKRKSQADGLGRLVAVFEPDVTTAGNPLAQQTSYAYNVLDELTQVSQGVQTRTYNYDALGRLSDATTPEAGKVTYQYDPVFYTLVTQRTDARNVITNYTYDTLNRLKQTSYNVVSATGVPATPTVTLTYGTDPTKNNNGRLLTMTDGVGSETYTYDPRLPLVTQMQKVISGTTYTTSQAYNLAGDLTSTTYPSGRVVQQSYDAIGRLCEIAPQTTGCGTATSPYATGYNYNPAFQLTGFNYGNGVTASFGYSADRLKLTSLGYAKSGQNLFSVNFWYKQDPTNCATGTAGNNGRVQCITDNVDAGRSVAYTYDALYRLTGAVTTGSANYPKWGLSWSYDRYGNRLSQGQTAGNPPMNSLSFANPGGAQTNHPDNYAHDLNGNMTNDGLNTLTYDAENRLVNSASGGTTTSYTYDGNGLRVTKQVGTSPATIYVFSGTKVIAEYALGAAVTAPAREYIYSSSQLLATVAGSTTTYHHADPFSVRMTTDPTGTVLKDAQGNNIGEQGHYPFGEVWYKGAGGTKWQFTSYERDGGSGESGNDYAMARYHVSRLGRFFSPDPLAGPLSNPQSHNRYAYVNNDPINSTDPLGLYCADTEADCIDHNDGGYGGWGFGWGWGGFGPGYDPTTGTGGSRGIGDVIFGYDIFDAIRGEPGTFISFDARGNMSWGFSYDLYAVTMNWIDQARANQAARGLDPEDIPNTGYQVYVYDYGALANVSGLVPDMINAQREEYQLRLTIPQDYGEFERFLRNIGYTAREASAVIWGQLSQDPSYGKWIPYWEIYFERAENIRRQIESIVPHR